MFEHWFPDGHQRGVFMQNSMYLVKHFSGYLVYEKLHWPEFGEVLYIFIPPFISQILDFIYWTVWIFILIYFEWLDIIKNQQLTNELLQIYKQIYISYRLPLFSHRILKASAHSCIFSNMIFQTFGNFFFIIISFAKKKRTDKQTERKLAGTPQQLWPTTAGPEH